MCPSGMLTRRCGQGVSGTHVAFESLEKLFDWARKGVFGTNGGAVTFSRLEGLGLAIASLAFSTDVGMIISPKLGVDCLSGSTIVSDLLGVELSMDTFCIPRPLILD